MGDKKEIRCCFYSGDCILEEAARHIKDLLSGQTTRGRLLKRRSHCHRRSHLRKGRLWLCLPCHCRSLPCISELLVSFRISALKIL